MLNSSEHNTEHTWKLHPSDLIGPNRTQSDPIGPNQTQSIIIEDDMATLDASIQQQMSHNAQSKRTQHGLTWKRHQPDPIGPIPIHWKPIGTRYQGPTGVYLTLFPLCVFTAG